ncbi:MAG: DUF1887 family CARF protein [Ottowia sp.]|nr:DUF1887 family CARF protein [Ottowia sp.]
MRIHVCLVSRRAAANLLAALDPVLRPGQVVLVATDKMQGHAADLQAVLQAQAIRVEQLRLHDAGDFQHAKARLLALGGRWRPMMSPSTSPAVPGSWPLRRWRWPAPVAGALNMLGDEIRVSGEARA